jgi:hypothetical protein
MAEVKAKLDPEKLTEQPFEKPKSRELVIIPKKEFLDWYKYTRGVFENIEMKKEKSGNFQECPNCRSTMEDHKLVNGREEELWHLCPQCDFTFSEKQHSYFTLMMMRLIKSSKKSKEGND